MEKFIIYKNQFKSLLIGGNGKRNIKPIDSFFIKNRDGNKCVCCGESNGRELSIDHIIPISKGGNNTRFNYMTLCSKCNSIKGNREIEYLYLKTMDINKKKSLYKRMIVSFFKKAIKFGILKTLESK